jgi:A/G-specific adenine glycosylase
MDKKKLGQFTKEIWKWYAENKRSFPWRKRITPYRVFVSEVMLQQTQASRVTALFPGFIRAFPSFSALARASNRDVLAAWQGLGYNRRALALKQAANVIVKEKNGRLPRAFEELVALPGIGKATARSIAAFAFNEPSVFIETNIRRVFIHWFFPRSRKVSDAMLEPFIAATLPERRKTREWFSALMDYGAMLGRESGKQNPNRRSAHYVRQAPFKGSQRELRGRIVRILLALGSASEQNIRNEFPGVPHIRIHEILLQLQKEGFISEYKGKFSLS